MHRPIRQGPGSTHRLPAPRSVPHRRIYRAVRPSRPPLRFVTLQRKSEPAVEPKAVSANHGPAPIEGEFEEVAESAPTQAPPLTDGARRIIIRKLSASSIGENDLFKAFEVGDWGDLAQIDANAILQWIGEASP